jgi:hypothetical protein
LTSPFGSTAAKVVGAPAFARHLRIHQSLALAVCNPQWQRDFTR